MQDGQLKPDFKAIQSRIVGREFDSALTELDGILSHEPENADALYMKAVCHRYLREFDAARNSNR